LKNYMTRLIKVLIALATLAATCGATFKKWPPY
jgi:hypothetical protein